MKNCKPCSLFLIFIISACHSEKATHIDHPDYINWNVYRGDKTSSQYSQLDQINKENVEQLQVAWTYHTGDLGERTTIQCNPIIVDGTMYVTSPQLKVIALDAATGQELWKYDPAKENKMGGVNRGITYWKEGEDERILFTAGHYLFALNVQTGQLIERFGEEGQVDLRKHLGKPLASISLSVTSPGIIYNRLLILGSALGEGYDAAPGHVRAYDIATGELAWIFHTIPEPGQPGYDTWQWMQGENYGGANAWGGFSLDEERGLVFLATGSAAFDFYGANRKGKNLYSDCIIALNAANGEHVWHYQAVHHDLWDYDLPCAPNLVTINHEGKKVAAVAQPTKMGHIILLDREKGAPLFPIEEREVPDSDVEQEEAWPTQPIPTMPEPFTRQGFSAADLTDITPEAAAYAAKEFAVMRGGPLFTPPSMEGTIMMPGTRGGAEWGGAAFDPATGILYINANEIPNILKLRKVETEVLAGASGKNLYQLNCANCHGIERQGAPPAIPALTNLANKYQKKDIVTIVAHGKGTMPAFSQFSENELSAVADFLLDKTSETMSVVQANQPETEQEVVPRYVIAGYNQFLDQDGYPAVKPPWGSLNAINLNTGKLLWKVPLGEYAELTAKGIPPTGTQNLGGVVATAGGLLFVGAAKDEKLRAFDKDTGKILWETTLPAGGYATPSTYQLNGKQYVVIAAGGGGKNGTKSGDAYVAFALPD